MRVLGIDPGFDRCGIAIVERKAGKERLVYSECATSNKRDAFPERLVTVGRRLEELIEEYAPEAITFETLFFNANVKTAMQVAEVRGMMLFIAASRSIPIYEYSPQAIKIAVTGYGNSDKVAVSSMVEKLVRPEKPIAHDDEYDAIAIALTCLAHLPNRGS